MTALVQVQPCPPKKCVQVVLVHRLHAKIIFFDVYIKKISNYRFLMKSGIYLTTAKKDFSASKEER